MFNYNFTYEDNLAKVKIHELTQQLDTGKYLLYWMQEIHNIHIYCYFSFAWGYGFNTRELS
jgi:hypothetical protein